MNKSFCQVLFTGLPLFGQFLDGKVFKAKKPTFFVSFL